MNEAVVDHFIFPFEAFPTFTTGAAFNSTLVWPDLAVDIYVRAK